MCGHFDSNHQIARRTTIWRGVTLSGKADFFQVFNAWRDFDRDRFRFATWSLDREVRLASLDRRSKWDGDFVFEIVPANGASAAWTTAPSELPEDIFKAAALPSSSSAEKIPKIERGMASLSPEALKGAASTGLIVGGAILIIHLAFFRITEDVVGLLDLLETDLRLILFIIFGQIWMGFSRQQPVGFLDLLLRGGTLYPENLVKIIHVGLSSHAKPLPRRPDVGRKSNCHGNLTGTIVAKRMPAERGEGQLSR